MWGIVEQLREIRAGQHLTHEKMDLIIKNQHAIMKTLADLQADVAANTGIEQSAVVLIKGLAAKIAALPVGDQAAIDALAQEVEASSSDLAAAVTANALPNS